MPVGPNPHLRPLSSFLYPLANTSANLQLNSQSHFLSRPKYMVIVIILYPGTVATCEPVYTFVLELCPLPPQVVKRGAARRAPG